MAFLENTMFEIAVSNSVNDQTQHIPGKFGTGTGEDFAAADCSAGFLTIKNGLLPSEGYEGITVNGNPILNGNSWYMNACASGSAAGNFGDHTGIYAFNNYDVSKAISTNGKNIWNIGFETLGLGLPAGERGDFCEIIIGEQYAFGAGNFSTVPTDATYKYATIENGLLVASTSAPAAETGVYFEILRSAPVTEGTANWGTKYVLLAKRTAEAA